jgi:ABC-type dipeptide/oligopeptide/nickel transport system permease component
VAFWLADLQLARVGTLRNDGHAPQGLNAISAVILIFGAIFILANIIVDLLVAYLDPRIRLRSARSD